MANAAAPMKDDHHWEVHSPVGIYPPGAWGEILADENSIIGQLMAPARVTFTDTPGSRILIAAGAAQMVGTLSASRSKEANEFAKFFFENVALATSALNSGTAGVDPFEFKPVPPKGTRIVSVTVKNMGRAPAPPFEE
jgi:hypothetical protein